MAICHFAPGLNPSGTLVKDAFWLTVGVGAGEPAETGIEGLDAFVGEELGGRAEEIAETTAVCPGPVDTVWK